MSRDGRFTGSKVQRKLSLPVALMLAAVLFSSVPASAQTRAPAKVKVLITFVQPPGRAEQALVRGVGGEIKYTYHLVPGIAASVPEAALKGLRHNPRVVAVELDGQVHLLDTELDNAWGVKRIGAGTVHTQGNRGAGVKVGILDTGIDLDHTDLAYDPSCSANFIQAETLDDGHGHGTHVAGIVAALDNDNGVVQPKEGVVGVAPEVTLCIYKIFDSGGNPDNTEWSDIIAALERAVDDGVQVTNHSYGASEDPGILVKAAYDNSAAAGVLHIAGAGNNGLFWFLGDNCIYPALWDSVVATAATTNTDARDMMSSTCPQLELAAPGTNVFSTMPGDGYGTKSGTSMASPHVAGTAALVWAANPGWSRDQVRDRLVATADDLGDPGHDSFFGYGLVDAAEAAASGSNSPPTADDQAVTTDEDTAVGITLTGSDPDGDELSFGVVTGPANGTLSGTAPNLTYTPNANYNGPDSFAFMVNDGHVNSNEATVAITVNAVNDAPVADDKVATTDEDTPVAITLTASDVDGDPLTYSVVTEPAHGTLSDIPPNLTYTPNSDYSGTDSFTFRVNDGLAYSSDAMVSITVNAVNDAPTADAQAVTTDEDTAVDITLTGSDLDGDTLSFVIVSGPTNGSLSGDIPNLLYTPDPDYSGLDSFTFRVNDGHVDSSVATVSITVDPVNDPPTASFTFECTELTCNFDASSSSDPDDGIVSYSWDFGDGNIGSGVAPSHSYAAGGTYYVTLTVTDSGGASDTDVQGVTVSDATPSLHAGDLDGSLDHANSKFWWAAVTITVHDQDESPVSGATVEGTWSGGASGSGSCLSGADGTCTVLSPKIAFAQESITFEVLNIVLTGLPYGSGDNHDPDGDSDGTSIGVSQMGNQPPVASFSYTCTDLTCDFDGSGSSDPDGSIVSYEWDFGDGATATGDTASHTYAAEGTYTVLLTVTDDNSAMDTETQGVPAGVSPGTMYVYYITIVTKSAGPNQSATAEVTIGDTKGSPVAGATVFGAWSGDYVGSVSGVTDAAGTVTFSSGKVKIQNVTFTFTVDDVVKEGYTYHPGLNLYTSVSGP